MNLTLWTTDASEEQFVVRYKCRDCGHRGTDFRDIVYHTMDGNEYDVECPKCESREADEAGLVKAKIKHAVKP